MKVSIEAIEKLEKISSVLEPNENTRMNWLSQTNAFINEYIKNLPTEKAFVSTDKHPSYHFDTSKQFSIDSILDELKTNFNDFGLKASSGGHIGYIPGGGIFPAALGDLLAAITNEYAGMYFGSPGAVTLENKLIDWMKEIFSFPASSVGNLTSGGSIANLIALTAARDQHQIKNEKIKSSVIYLTEQVHHCIHKAIRIIGLEDIVIRHVQLDNKHRMDTKALKNSIQNDISNGLHPFLIIASAGTTDTGAIDPLDDIATISEQSNTWFHIDGAYGGFFYLLEEMKDKMKGISRANSLVIDPHKGLFLPYGLGVVLVKNKESVFTSHHYTANYMQDAYEENLPINPADVSPELTKHFRGLRLWLPIKLLGIAPFKACLKEKLLLTHYFREELEKLGFKVGPTPDLSVSYFYYPNNDLEKQNKINHTIHQEILKDGSVFLSSSIIDNAFVIRIAILSFRTKKSTIDKAIKMLKTIIEKI